MQDWPRPLVHVDIRARDPERLKAFYAGLFSWEFDGLRFSAGLGGPEPGPGGALRQSGSPGITLYLQVRDLAESLAAVPGLGGTVVREPADVPGGPSVASVTDPEGNRLVLVQQ